MNDEIKEILDNVKKCCDITKEQNFTVYQRQDILKLLDYITNLQKENEKLKELCDKYEEEHNTAFKLWKMKMEEIPTYEEKEDYKKRIAKAIEHIEKHQFIFQSQYRDESNFDNHLLDILKGDSNE